MGIENYWILTRPLLSVAFKSLGDIPFSKISVKHSLSSSSFPSRDARSNLLTIGTCSKLILNAFSRADNNELLEIKTKKKLHLISLLFFLFFSLQGNISEIDFLQLFCA